MKNKNISINEAADSLGLEGPNKKEFIDKVNKLLEFDGFDNMDSSLEDDIYDISSPDEDAVVSDVLTKIKSFEKDLKLETPDFNKEEEKVNYHKDDIGLYKSELDLEDDTLEDDDDLLGDITPYNSEHMDEKKLDELAEKFLNENSISVDDYDSITYDIDNEVASTDDDELDSMWSADIFSSIVNSNVSENNNNDIISSWEKDKNLDDVKKFNKDITPSWGKDKNLDDVKKFNKDITPSWEKDKNLDKPTSLDYDDIIPVMN